MNIKNYILIFLSFGLAFSQVQSMESDESIRTARLELAEKRLEGIRKEIKILQDQEKIVLSQISSLRESSPVRLFQRQLLDFTKSKNIAAAKELILRNIDLINSNNLGQDALKVAVDANNNDELVELLLSHAKIGKNVLTDMLFYTLNHWKFYPLRGANINGVNIIKLLLEKGANPNALTRYKNIPLVTAVRLGTKDPEGAQEVISLLLEKGANVNQIAEDLPGHAGVTALAEAEGLARNDEYATSMKPIVQLLEIHGAK